MTLDEAKKKAYDIMQSHMHAMRDVINDPSQLQTNGHKTLESFLRSRVLYVCKETDKIFKEYERTNP